MVQYGQIVFGAFCYSVLLLGGRGGGGVQSEIEGDEASTGIKLQLALNKGNCLKYK